MDDRLIYSLINKCAMSRLKANEWSWNKNDNYTIPPKSQDLTQKAYFTHNGHGLFEALLRFHKSHKKYTPET